MKRWAVLTVLLYALALIVLSVPVTFAAMANWGKNDMNVSFHDLFQLYLQWDYWLWLGVLVGGQALLLLLPIDISERRLPARRKLKVPVIVTGFFLANLLVAGIFSIICAIFTDNSYYAFSFVDWLLGHKTGGAGQPQGVDVTGWGFATSALIVVGIFWIALGFHFQPLCQIRRTRLADQTRRALAAARQHFGTARCRAEPRHRPPPRRLLRARRNFLGNCHGHFRHAALLRPRCFFSVRRTV